MFTVFDLRYACSLVALNLGMDNSTSCHDVFDLEGNILPDETVLNNIPFTLRSNFQGILINAVSVNLEVESKSFEILKNFDIVQEHEVELMAVVFAELVNLVNEKGYVNSLLNRANTNMWKLVEGDEDDICLIPLVDQNKALVNKFLNAIRESLEFYKGLPENDSQRKIFVEIADFTCPENL